MPKKHAARGRHNPQAQRPQPKRKDVMLVRTPSATQVIEAEEDTSEEQELQEAPRIEAPKSKITTAKPAAAAVPVKTPEKRPAVPAKTGGQPARQMTTQRGGRPGQRSALRPHERAMASRAHLVSAENYRYVLKDLRKIAILAVVMFSALIALTFIVPHLSFLNY